MDELAAAMEAVLNDDSYRSVFERPRIKMASLEEKKSQSKDNTIKQAFKQLVEASRILDDLGLFKSSELALSAVEALASEASDCSKCKSSCEKCSGDADCKCKCADDSNDADDKKDNTPPWLKKKEEDPQVKKPGDDKPAEDEPVDKVKDKPKK